MKKEIMCTAFIVFLMINEKNYRTICNIATFVLKALKQAIACIDKNEDLYNFYC